MEGNTVGFVNIIADKEDAKILGACVGGDGATEIINSMLAIKVAGGSTLIQL